MLHANEFYAASVQRSTLLPITFSSYCQSLLSCTVAAQRRTSPPPYERCSQELMSSIKTFTIWYLLWLCVWIIRLLLSKINPFIQWQRVMHMERAQCDFIWFLHCERTVNGNRANGGVVAFHYVDGRTGRLFLSVYDSLSDWIGMVVYLNISKTKRIFRTSFLGYTTLWI